MPEPEIIKTTIIARKDGIETDTTAETPRRYDPNIRVEVISATRAIAVRVVRVYLMTLTGLLSAAFTGLDSGVLPNAFGPAVLLCGQMALAPAFMAFLQNALEIFNRWDVTRPGLRA